MGSTKYHSHGKHFCQKATHLSALMTIYHVPPRNMHRQN